MFKTILVPATGSDSDAAVFAAALGVARLFEAHMEFLHVSVDPVEVLASAMASADAGGAGAMAAEWIDRLETDAQELAEKTRRAVETFCEREAIPIRPTFDPSRISASWHCEKGREAYWVPTYGREADLVVLGRDEAGVLTATLFESGRPLLLPGAMPSQRKIETAVIAWKPTREAARAVSAATPILEKCKRIVVLTVTEGENDDSGSADRLVAALTRHNVEAEARTLRPNGGEAMDVLFHAVAEIPADLVVMGGYGHSRVRETIFGGFTRHVLRGADAPVLIAH
jgi:nucleotide-binding universal stress UspA family protein